MPKAKTTKKSTGGKKRRKVAEVSQKIIDRMVKLNKRTDALKVMREKMEKELNLILAERESISADVAKEFAERGVFNASLSFDPKKKKFYEVEGKELENKKREVLSSFVDWLLD